MIYCLGYRRRFSGRSRRRGLRYIPLRGTLRPHEEVGLRYFLLRGTLRPHEEVGLRYFLLRKTLRPHEEVGLRYFLLRKTLRPLIGRTRNTQTPGGQNDSFVVSFSYYQALVLTLINRIIH